MSLLSSYYQNSNTPQPRNYFLNNNILTPTRQMSMFLSDTNKTKDTFGLNSYSTVERKIQNEQLNKEDLSYPILYKKPIIEDELGKKRNCHSINTLNLYLPFSIDELHVLYEMAENNEKVDKLKLPMWTALVSKGKEETLRRIGNYKGYEDNIDKNDIMIYDEWKRQKGVNMDNTFEAMNRKVDINMNRRDNMNRGGYVNPFLNNNNNINSTNNNNGNIFNPFNVKTNLTNVFNNISGSNYTGNNNNYNQTGTVNNNPFAVSSNQGGTNSSTFYNPFISTNNKYNNTQNTNNNTTKNIFNPFANNSSNYPFSNNNNNNNNQVSSTTNPFINNTFSNNNTNSNTNIFNPFIKNNSTNSNNNNPFNCNNNMQQNSVYNPFSGTNFNYQTNPFISNTPITNQQIQTTPNPFTNPFTINPTSTQVIQIPSSITNPFALPSPSPILTTPTNHSFYQTQPTNNSFLTPIKNTNYNHINPYYSASNPYYVMPVSFVLPSNSTTTMFTPSKQLTSKEYEDILNKAQITYSQQSLKDELSENEVEIKEIRQDSFILSSLKKKRKTVNSQTQSTAFVSSADIYWNRKMKGSLSYYSVNRNKLKSPSKTFDINEFIQKFKHEDNKHANDVIQEEDIETDSKKIKGDKLNNIIYNLLCKVSFNKSINDYENEINPINISLKYTKSNIANETLKKDLINSIKCISSQKYIHIEHDNIEFKQSFLNSQEIDFSKIETTNQCYENLTEIKIFNVECVINLVKENKNIDLKSEDKIPFLNKVETCKDKIAFDISQINKNEQEETENVVLENDKAKISFHQPVNVSNLNFDSIIIDNKALTIKVFDDDSLKKEELKQIQVKFDIVFKGIFIDETEEAFLKNIVEPCLNNLNTETFEYDSKKGELQIKNLNLKDFA